MEFLAILLAFLPGFAWLFFYLEEDPHREPKRYIALTFFMGMTAGVFTLGVQFIVRDMFVSAQIPIMGILALLVFSGIEELFKFGAAKLSVRHNPSFSEPIDAMIYAIVAALGFATLENLGAVAGRPGAGALLIDTFQIASFRFIGATLLHTLAAGIIGFYWAKSIREFGAIRPLIFGFVIATAVHTIFNYLIITYGNIIYPVLFLIVVGFFVFGDFEKLKHQKL